MKKIILLILLSIIFVSCWKQDNNIVNNNNNVVNKKVVLEKENKENIINNKKKLSKEDFYKIKVPDNFINTQEFYDNFSDVKWFLWVIKKDKNLVEEQEFYNIWSDWLYWTNYTNWEVEKLRKCIKWEISYDNLDWIYKDICKWENKWLTWINTNYYHIKDWLLNYKKILNWEDFDCSYFIKDNYRIDDKYQRILFKKNDYLICKLFKWESENNIVKETFYYIKAKQLLKCEYLNDKNLVELCLEEIKLIE